MASANAGAIGVYLVAGRENWRTAYARQRLGRTLRRQHQFVEAETKPIESDRVLSMVADAPIAYRVDCVGTLIKLFEDWKKSKPDQGLATKADYCRVKPTEAIAPSPPAAQAPEYQQRGAQRVARCAVNNLSSISPCIVTARPIQRPRPVAETPMLVSAVNRMTASVGFMPFGSEADI